MEFSKKLKGDFFVYYKILGGHVPPVAPVPTSVCGRVYVPFFDAVETVSMENFAHLMQLETQNFRFHIVVIFRCFLQGIYHVIATKEA